MTWINTLFSINVFIVYVFERHLFACSATKTFCQKCVVLEAELKRLRSGGKLTSPVDQESMVAQAMAKAVEADSIPSRAPAKGKAEPQVDTSMVSQMTPRQSTKAVDR